MLVMPSTRAMFAMFEPMTLPITMPGRPLRIASIDDESSGREVPSATTVAPTMKSDAPRTLAKWMAESVMSFALYRRAARLSMKIMYSSIGSP